MTRIDPHALNVETYIILECKKLPISTGMKKKGNKAHGTIHVTSDNDRHIGGWEPSVTTRTCYPVYLSLWIQVRCSKLTVVIAYYSQRLI